MTWPMWRRSWFGPIDSTSWRSIRMEPDVGSMIRLIIFIVDPNDAQSTPLDLSFDTPAGASEVAHDLVAVQLQDAPGAHSQSH